MDLLRWVKASSDCIIRDTEVCEGIAIIRRHFTEWLPCEGFLALLVVLWPLVCNVEAFAIDDCELDRSNSQQGYN